MNAKKILAVILIVSITVSNAGMATLAVSIQRIASTYTEAKNEKDKDIAHRYHEEFSYEKTSYLLNDEGDSFDTENDENIDNSIDNSIDNTEDNNKGIEESESSSHDEESYEGESYDEESHTDINETETLESETDSNENEESDTSIEPEEDEDVEETEELENESEDVTKESETRVSEIYDNESDTISHEETATESETEYYIDEEATESEISVSEDVEKASTSEASPSEIFLELNIASPSEENKLFKAEREFILPKDWKEQLQAAFEDFTPRKVTRINFERYKQGSLKYIQLEGSGGLEASWSGGRNPYLYIYGEKMGSSETVVYLPEDASDMFAEISIENANDIISYLNPSRCKNMTRFFYDCGFKVIYFNNWDLSNVEIADQMFEAVTSLTTIYVDKELFDPSKLTSYNNMFRYCSALYGGSGTRSRDYQSSTEFLARIDLGEEARGLFTKVYTLNKPWFGDEQHAGKYADEITKVTFADYKTPIPSTGTWTLNTGLIGSINGTECTIHIPKGGGEYIFYNDDYSYFFSSENSERGQFKSLVEIGNTKSIFKTFSSGQVDEIRVTNCEGMFRGCKSLKSVDLSQFGIKNYRMRVASMFEGCESLTEIDFDNALVAINTSGENPYINSIENMCNGCKNLEKIYLTSFTIKTTELDGTFKNCEKLEEIVLPCVKEKETSKVRMNETFYNCKSLKTIYSFRDFYQDTDCEGVNTFTGCTNLKGPLGTSYSSSNSNDVNMAILDGGSSKKGYFTLYCVLERVCASKFEFTNTQCIRICSHDDIVEPTTGLIDGGDRYKYIVSKNILETIIYLPKTANKKLFLAFDATSLFERCNELKTIIGIKYLDTKYTKSMISMFNRCSKLQEIDITGFDTSRCTTMDDMFSKSGIKKMDLRGLKKGKVENMNSMFRNCEDLEYLHLPDFNSIENVPQGTSAMFYYLTNVKAIYAYHDWYNSTDASYYSNTQRKIKAPYHGYYDKELEAGALLDTPEREGKLTSVQDKYTLPPGWYGTSQRGGKYAKDIKSIKIINIEDGAPENPDATWDIANSGGLKGYVKGNDAYIYIPDYSQYIFAAQNSSYLFSSSSSNGKFSSLESIDLNRLLTYDATNMSYMFSGMSKIRKIDISNFSFKNTTNVSYMFSNASSLIYISLPVIGDNKIQNMSYMFSGCSEITDIIFDLIDTSNVTNTSYMYNNCSKLESIHMMGEVNYPRVNSSSYMFLGCSKLVGGSGFKYDSSKTNINYACIDLDEKRGYYSKFACFDKNCFPDTSGADKMFYERLEFYTQYDIDEKLTADFTESLKLNGAKYYVEDRKIAKIYLPKGYGTRMYTPEDAQEAFSGFNSITEIVGLEIIDTKLTKNMKRMFYYSLKLESINCGNFDVSNVEDFSDMFAFCRALKRVDISNWEVNSNNIHRILVYCDLLEEVDVSAFAINDESDISTIFGGSENLKTIYSDKDWNVYNGQYVYAANSNLLEGGNGTKAAKLGLHDFYRVDREGVPGAFTQKYYLSPGWYGTSQRGGKYAKDITKISIQSARSFATPSDFDASWELPNSNGVMGYVKGTEVTILIPKNGKSTIFAATDSTNLFSSTNTNGVFSSLKQIENLNMLRTRDCVSLSRCFYNTNSLTSLDLEKFDTHYASDLSYMFYGNKKLSYINLLSFDTYYAYNMSYMFAEMTRIGSLNLSSFDTRYVQHMTSLFDGCSELKAIYVDNDFRLDNLYPTSGNNIFRNVSNIVGGAGTKHSTQKTDYKMLIVDGGSGKEGYLSKRYTISPEWYGEGIRGGKYASQIAKISIKSWIDIGTPSNTDSWVIGNGTTCYIDGEEVTILIPKGGGYNLYTEENSAYLFSHVNVSAQFSYVSEIENLDVLRTEHSYDMSYMFCNLKNIKELYLRMLDTSRATNMSYMFGGCQTVKEIDLSAFDTRDVTDMKFMLQDCINVKEIDLSTFDTQNVTNFTSMFMGDQELTTIYVESDLKLSSESEIGLPSAAMFTGCNNLVGGSGTVFSNANITKTYAKIDMGGSNKGYFTRKHYINPNWYGGVERAGVKAKSVETITFINSIEHTTPSNADASWELPKTNGVMVYLKNNQVYISIPKGGGKKIFASPDSSYLFSSTVSDYKFASLKRFYNMQSLSTKDAVDMSHFFDGLSTIDRINLIRFDTRVAVYMNHFFYNMSKLKYLDVSSFDTRYVNTMEEMFGNCSELIAIYVDENFNTQNLLGSKNLFTNNTKLVGASGTAYNTSKRTHTMAKIDMGSTEEGYFTAKYIINKNWYEGLTYGKYANEISTISFVSALDSNTPTYTQNWEMINSNGLKAYLHGDEVIIFIPKGGGRTVFTSEDSSYLFSSPEEGGRFDKLTTIKNIEYLQTIYSENMSYMFGYCTSINNIDISNFDTRNVTNMSYMFNQCSSLEELNLKNFDTREVTNMSYMFNNCRKIKNFDIYSFETQNVTNTSYMFASCIELESIYVVNELNFDKVTISVNMFNASTKLVGGAGTIYESGNINKEFAKIDLGASKKGYFTKKYILPPNWYGTSATQKRGDKYAREISTISFVSAIDKASPNAPSWVIENSNGLYGIVDNTTVIIYIPTGGGRKVFAAANSNHLFNNSSGADGRFSSVKEFENIASLDTSETTSMSYMFANMESLKDIDLSNIKTDRVTDMTYMFSNMKSIEYLYLDDFYTKKVKMFSNMFSNMTSLKRIYINEDFDLTSYDNTNGTNMFANDTNLIGGKGTKYTNGNTGMSYAKIDDGNIGYFTKIRYYNVVFMNFGKPIATQSVLVYQRPKEPEDPEVPEGYEGFDGWFKEEDLQYIWDFELDEISDNIMLYAGYDEVHIHRYCGISTDSVCEHNIVGSHEFSKFRKLSRRVLRNEGFPNKGAYYLYEDLDVATIAELKGSFVLCLNGHTIKNINFKTSEDNIKVTITNCQIATGSIVSNTNDDFTFENVDTDIIGGVSTIYVKSNKLINSDKKDHRHYNASFAPVTSGAESNSDVVVVKGTNSNVFTLASVSVSRYKVNGHSLIDIVGNDTLLSNVSFDGNEVSKYVLSNDSNVKFESDVRFNNNKLKVNSANSSIVYIKNAENEFNLESCLLDITNNTSVMQGSGDYIASAIRLGGKSHINISSSSLAIYDNNKTGSSHIYDIYSENSDNDTAILKIKDGQKYNKNLKVGGIAFAGNTGYGRIIDSWTKENTEKYDSYRLSFNADTYKQSALKIVKDKESVLVNEGYDVEFKFEEMAYISATQSIIKGGKAEKPATPSSPLGGDFIDWYKDVKYENTWAFDVDTVEKETVLYGKFIEHWHKICGVASNSVCNHTLTSTHSEAYRYLEFIKEDLTEEQIIEKLASGGKYYLSSPLVFDTLKEVVIKNDLYLCLNGYSAKNVIFKSQSNETLYITNCSEEKISVLNNESAETLFTDINVEIYGNNNNLVVNSNEVYTQTTANKKFITNNVTFTKSDFSDSNQSAIITLTNKAKVYMENTVFDTFDGVSSFLTSENYNHIEFKNVTATKIRNVKRAFIDLIHGSPDEPNVLILKGKNYFKDNDYCLEPQIYAGYMGFINIWGGKFILEDGETVIYGNKNLSLVDSFIYMHMRNSMPGEFTTKEGSKLIIDGNTLKRPSENSSFGLINFADNTGTYQLLGDIQITNNKYVNCTTTNNQGKISVINVRVNTVTVGNGLIEISDNKSYVDDGETEADINTYRNHEVISIYSDANNYFTPMFRQQANTKFRKDNKIGQVAFAHNLGYGHIIDDFNSITAEYVYSGYDTFIANRSVNNELTIVMDGDNLTVNVGYKVEFIIEDKYAVATQTIIKDGKIKVPATPSAPKGYVFESWYKDSTHQTKWNFSVDVVTEDMILYGRFEKVAHIHKVCGISTDSECTHTYMVNTHDTAYLYKDLPLNLTREKFEEFVNADDSYYFSLSENLDFGETPLLFNKDAYICLNGYNMVANFADSRFKVTISNCQNEKSHLGGNYEYLFNNMSFDVYGREFEELGKNIELEARSIFSQSSTTAKQTYIYNVELIKHDAVALANRSFMNIVNASTLILEDTLMRNQNTANKNSEMISVNAEGAKATLKDVTFENVYTYRNRFIDGQEVTIDLLGHNKIIEVGGDSHNNSFIHFDTGSLNVIDGKTIISSASITEGSNIIELDEAKLNIATDSTLEIVNNFITRKSAIDGNPQYILMSKNDDISLRGNLIIENNKFIKASGDGDGVLAALYMPKKKSIYISSGSLVINNNKSYNDDGNVLSDKKNQHVYELYTSDEGTTPLFIQYEGTKFSTSSIINGMYYGEELEKPHTVIKNWNENTSYDHTKYKEIFIYDKFIDSKKGILKNKENEIYMFDIGYTVHFDKNVPVYEGETFPVIGSMEDIFVETDTIATLPEADYRTVGAKFMGWNYNALLICTFSEAYIKSNLIDFADRATISNLASRSTVNLYAVWKLTAHKAKLNANGGKFYSNNQEIKVVSIDENGTVSFEEPKRDGYIFNYYTLESVDGAIFDEKTWIYEGDRTLYANWSPISYTIRYDGNGSDNDRDTSMLSETIYYGQEITLKENKFKKDGYKFNYWTYDGKTYADTASISNLTIVPGTVITFKADWDPNEYKVYYSGNGNTSGSMDADDMVFGTAKKLTANKFEKTDYTFIGWNTDPNSKFVMYGDTALFNPRKYLDRIDLHAVWYFVTEYTGILTIDGNGGLVNGVSEYKLYGEYGDTIELPTFERKGYRVSGYKEVNDDGTEIDYFMPKTMDFMGNKRIKVEWEEVIYDLKYHSNTKTDEISTISNIKYTDNIVISGKLFENEGYTFIGWSEDDLATYPQYVEGETVNGLTEDKEITLYAVYENHKVNITYVGNGESRGHMSPRSYKNKNNEFLELNTYEKDDYTFLGWSRDENATTADYYDGEFVDYITMDEDDITLYAVWLSNELVRFIVYDANGGIVNGRSVAIVPVASGSTVSRHPRAIREGYTFANWNKEGAPVGDIYVDFKEDISLYASWDEGLYKLSYKGMGATNLVMPTEDRPYSLEFRLTENAYRRLGYKFDGWDLSRTGRNIVYVDRATVSKLADVGETRNLYAVWSGKEYKIVYNPNGGYGIVATTSFIYGKDAYLAENKFTYSGKESKGWIYKKGNADIFYSSNQAVNSLLFDIDDDTEYITLYANFNERKMGATLDANGGVFDDGTTSKTIWMTEGEPVAFEEPRKEGYNFIGYEMSGSLYEDTIWTFSENKKFRATWSAINYTVSFSAKGQNKPMPSLNMTYDEEKALIKNEFTKEGYDFDKWILATRSFADEEVVKNLTNVDEDKVTLIANFKPKTYNIIYDGNGNTSGVMNSDIGVPYGVDYRLKENKYSKSEYIFTGWSKVKDGNVIYGDMATISFLESYEENKNLYANWIASKSVAAKIIMHGNQGSVNGVSTYTMYLKDRQPIIAPIASRLGYKFTKWTTSDGVEFEFPEVCDFKGEIEIFANWEELKYIVAYRSNDETGRISTVSVSFNEEFTLKTNEWTRPGYEFSHWSLDLYYGDVLNEGQSVKQLSYKDGDVVNIYAIWKGKTIEVIYDGNGSTFGKMASASYTFGAGDRLRINYYRKDGYEFGGWVTDPTQTVTKYFNRNLIDNIILTENADRVTLYANWVLSNEAIFIVYDGNEGLVNGEKRTKLIIKAGSPFKSYEAVRKGYRHTGYVNEANVDFVESQAINISTIAYAKWQEKEYDVLYDGNRNTRGSMSNKHVRYFEEFNLDENKFEKLGYSFVGWDVDEMAQTITYVDKATVSKLTENDSKKVYAVWYPKTYTIAYDSNGGDGTVASTSFIYDRQNIIAHNSFVKEGFNSNGWEYIKKDGTVVRFESGIGIDISNIEIDYDTEVVNLIAHYDEPDYEVTLNSNGGKFRDGRTEIVNSVRYNEMVSFEEPIRTGYNFEGYYAGNEKVGSHWPYHSSKNLIASWSAISYKIKFDGNGADNGVAMSVFELNYDEEKNLPDNLFAKTGFEFNGWKYRNEIIANKAAVKNLTSKNGEEITLVAKWGPRTYSIKYDKNDSIYGTMPDETGIVYGKDHRLKENIYGKPDHYFMGWSKSPISDVVYGDMATISAAEPYEANKHIFARWIDKKLVAAMIEIDGNGGSINGVSKFTMYLQDRQTINPPSVYRRGYRFTGFTTMDGRSYSFPNECNFKGTIYIKANWEEIKYDVVYHSNNGENKVATKSVFYNESFEIMTNIWDRQGYNFDKWTTDRGGYSDIYYTENEIVRGITENEIIDLYAKWVGKTIEIRYEGNGATAGGISTESYTYGSDERLKDNYFSRNGYVFGGWVVDNTSRTAKFFNRHLIDEIYDSELTEQITVYANWVERSKAITIIYDGNSGTVNGERTTSLVVEKGSAFKSYLAKKVGNNHVGYMNKDSVDIPEGTIINVATVAFAKWVEKNYTLYYDGKGHTRGDMPSETHSYSEEFNLSENEFEKIGYEFKGWDNLEEGRVIVYKDKATVSKLTDTDRANLYAVWGAKTYTIKYMPNGGNGNVDDSSIVYGQHIYLQNNTYTSSHGIANGWKYINKNGDIVRFGSGTSVSTDDFDIDLNTNIIMLYAHFDEISFEATIDANGGKFRDGRTVITKSVRVGDYIVFEEPKREGFVFDGYMVDGVKLGYRWNYDENKTLIATWRHYEYLIRYDGNGGNGYMRVDVATYGELYTIRENEFKNDGYKFIGWKYNNTTYKPGDVVSELSNRDYGIVTFETMWSGQTYDVYYHGNGHTKGSMDADKKVEYGKPYQIKENKYEKDLYTFTGWALSSASTVAYKSLATVSDFGNFERRIDLYAKWKYTDDIVATLILKGNGGTINGIFEDTIYLEKDEVIMQPTTYRRGYKFDYWKDVDTGEELSALPNKCTFEGTKTLEAIWKEIEYRVVYHSNNGLYEETESRELKFLEDYTIENNTYSYYGHEFEWWSYKTDETRSGEKSFEEGETVRELAGKDGDVINLYASWKGHEFRITLDGSDPTTGETTVATYSYGKKTNLIENPFTKNGYTFSGWALANDKTRVKYLDEHYVDYIYKELESDDITLYAVWIEDSKVINMIFDGNGGTINGSTKVKVALASDSYIPYPKAERKGYIQKEWLEEDMTTIFDREKVDFANDKTIYASYEEGTYTVIYDGRKADNADMGSELRRYTEEFELRENTYKKLGYTFKGWDILPEAKVPVYEDKATVSELADVGEIIKLFAVWEENIYNIKYINGDEVVGLSKIKYNGTTVLRPNTFAPIGKIERGYTYQLGGTEMNFLSGQIVSMEDFSIDYDTKDILLRTGFENEIYNLIFDAGRGKYSNGESIVRATSSYGEEIRYPENPTFGRRVFNGYKVDGNFFRDNYYYFATDKTFKADWEKATYSVVYHKNTPVSPGNYDNVINEEMATQSFIEEDNQKLSKNKFKLTGYTFIGWATQSYIPEEAERLEEENSELIIPDERIANFDADFGAVYDLYALWTRNKMKVKLAKSESYNPSIPDPYLGEFEIRYDQKFSDLSAFEDKTRNGYTYTGMFTKAKIANPIDKRNYSGEIVKNHITKDVVNRNTKNFTLYPLWLNDEQVVTLEIRDGKMPKGYNNLSFIAYYDAPYFIKGTASEPKDKKGNIISPIATPDETRMFDAWSTDIDGNNRINGTDLYLDKNITVLYANYRDRREFTVSFDSGSGSGNMASFKIYEGKGFNAPPCSFYKNNYLFDNWKGSDGATYNVGSYIVVNSDLTLTATWYKRPSGNKGNNGGGSGGSGSGKGTLDKSKAPNVPNSAKYEIKNVIQSKLSEGSWVADSEGRWRYEIPVEKQEAQTIMSSAVFDGKWTLNEGGQTISIRDGMYKIDYLSSEYFFGLDADGIMMTGFVKTTGATKQFAVDFATGYVVEGDKVEEAKYYLMESGIYMGVLWNQTIEINGILYEFDINGRIISETQINEEDNGMWFYEPETDDWKYLVQAVDGSLTYLMNETAAIPYMGQVYYYMFDEKGNMRTGFNDVNGKTYYLMESGALKGSIYVGELTVGDTVFTFNTEGVLVETSHSKVAALDSTQNAASLIIENPTIIPIG